MLFVLIILGIAGIMTSLACLGYWWAVDARSPDWVWRNPGTKIHHVTARPGYELSSYENMMRAIKDMRRQ